MADLEILKNKIAASSWGELEKQQITDLLPILGQETLDFLDIRLGHSDFSMVQTEIYISV